MLSFFFTKVLCYVVGITVPGYGSFRALETLDPTDEKQWLTYWVVFAMIETIEEFGYVILSWIPFYYELKLVAILWLVLPGTRGAERVYNEVLGPLLHNYASMYDPTFKSDRAPKDAETERALFQHAKDLWNMKGPHALDELRAKMKS